MVRQRLGILLGVFCSTLGAAVSSLAYAAAGPFHPLNPPMHLDDAIAHCLSLPHVVEETPFGPEVLVYKVGGKMFALTDPNDFPPAMNLKCDPDRAEALRDQYRAIAPGYHMNKRHWNTLTLDGSLPGALVRELIEHSYALVVASLPARTRAAL